MLNQPKRYTHQEIHQIKRWRVVSLAVSAFIFNTSEFIPVAVLSDIAKSFAMPVAQTGLMITLYAWIVALLSVPAVLITAKIERRKLLMAMLALFVVSHAVSAVASNFAVLMLSRTGVALAHAVFWSITASLVVRVAPKGEQTQALGLLAMGSALALVLGLPLGRVVGQYLGWRTTFGAIGALALGVMGLLWYLLPKLPSKNAGSIASLGKLLKNRQLLSMYILTASLVTADFTGYSYVEPFLRQINGFSENFTTLILLLFGVAGIVASRLFSGWHEQNTRGFLAVSIGALLASLLLMASCYFPLSWVVLALLWGVAMMAIGLSLQVQVLQLAPEDSDVAMAIFSGIYNVGIGGGALVGHYVIGGWGLSGVGYVGAMIGLLGMLVALWVFNPFASNK